MKTYEQQLNDDTMWALREGSLHFEKSSAVHKTLVKIAMKLDEIGVPYAIAGGMALFFHGYRRFTEDVDILVTREGLEKIHEHLDGLGYVRPFPESKNLRDTQTGVKIDFLIAGGFPGDGMPKPVAFPDPAGAGIKMKHLNFLDLPRLIELKLASGLSNPLRGQDIIDVQNLIMHLKLPLSVGDSLNPYVRAKYVDLWNLVASSPPGEE